MNTQTTKPENDLGSFHVSENELSDGSTTADVYYSTPYGQEVVAEPPSKENAIAMADALNQVRTAFLDCGSDRETWQLHAAIMRAIQVKR